MALSQALSLKTLEVLKSPKLSKRRPTIFVGKNPNPRGGGGLDGILNPSPPPNHPRTKELKRILVSSRVTNKVEIDDVSQTLSTFLTGMNFPNYLASLEKSSE